MHSSNDNLSSRESPQVQASSFRLGPAPAATLYILLLGSAVLTLGARRFPGLLPKALEIAAPVVFLLFLICFGLYRLALVRAKKYTAFKAFFQVGVAVLFLTLLLPDAKSRYDIPADDLEVLLTDGNPRVRALAAEVIRYRADGARYGPLLVKALKDSNERVREEAHHSLVQLSGGDLGPAEDPRALDAWEKRFP